MKRNYLFPLHYKNTPRNGELELPIEFTVFFIPQRVAAAISLKRF